jgi:CRISPR/Cas system-associated exonuclease Cas4 (RecB family)
MAEAITVKQKKVMADFEALSDKRKKEVADFISYLRAREEIEATKEIIRDTDFLKSIMRGEEDFRKGRFKKWSEVKEDV